MVDNEEEQSSIIFGNGFGSITDLETGPDGYLYVLSHRDPQWMDGVISRIVPSSSTIEEVTETVSPISPIGGQVQNEDDDEEEGSENEGDENGDDENN